MIRILLKGYLGTQMPYIYKRTKETPPPKDYEVCYISHVGRHGARYLVKPEAITALLACLQKAKCKGQLTPCGEQVAKELSEIYSLEMGQAGKLTKTGLRMEMGIAKRMVEKYRPVFNKQVISISTNTERTKASMAAFLVRVQEEVPTAKIEAGYVEGEDPILRFFDLNKAYLDYQAQGYWHEILKTFEKRKSVEKQVLGKLFKPKFIAEVPKDFVSEIYKIYCNQFDIVGDFKLGQLFTLEELKFLWENENLRQYLEKGPSWKGQCLPTNIAFPLLMDFLAQAERAIKQDDVGVNLRFAHAETIIPFSGLLRINGFFNQICQAEHVAKIWQDYWVAPMAANLQWIFYKGSEEQPILVKFLYNESEVTLPIYSAYLPYYKWEEMKAFYLNILKQLQLDWQQNLLSMVKSYKGERCPKVCP